jgi:hypothetical protein
MPQFAQPRSQSKTLTALEPRASFIQDPGPSKLKLRPAYTEPAIDELHTLRIKSSEWIREKMFQFAASNLQCTIRILSEVAPGWDSMFRGFCNTLDNKGIFTGTVSMGDLLANSYISHINISQRKLSDFKIYQGILKRTSGGGISYNDHRKLGDLESKYKYDKNFERIQDIIDNPRHFVSENPKLTRKLADYAASTLIESVQSLYEERFGLHGKIAMPLKEKYRLKDKLCGEIRDAFKRDFQPEDISRLITKAYAQSLSAQMRHAESWKLMTYTFIALIPFVGEKFDNWLDYRASKRLAYE